MKFTLYTKENCSYCDRAKALISQNGHEYEALVFPTQVTKEDIQSRVNESGAENVVVRSVPQIFHENRYVGGFSELLEYLREN